MKRKLVRNTDKGMISGVCAGLSDYTGIDVSIVRLIWAALFFLWGTGLGLYILAWLIIPED